MERGDAFEFRTLYALTLYALTPKNHNVRNTPDGRKLILREPTAISNVSGFSGISSTLPCGGNPCR
jgi:hypothetical protein